MNPTMTTIEIISYVVMALAIIVLIMAYLHESNYDYRARHVDGILNVIDKDDNTISIQVVLLDPMQELFDKDRMIFEIRHEDGSQENHAS